MGIVEAIMSALMMSVTVIIGFILYGLFMHVVKSAITWVLARLLGINLANLVVNVGTFVGVIHHEFSHALMAVLTGAKVTSITWFTLFGNGTLGSVVFTPRGSRVMQHLQLTASSLAPLYCGTITLFLMLQYSMANAVSLHSKEGYILAYLAFSILLHCDLSKQDIVVAKKGLRVFAFILFILGLLANLFM